MPFQSSYLLFIILFSFSLWLCHVRLLATPWTAAYQAPPSMGFSRQQYWSGVPLLSPKATRCYHTPNRKAETQNTDNTECWWGCGATGTLAHCWRDVKRCGHLGRQFGSFLPYNAATLAPIYLKELKLTSTRQPAYGRYSSHTGKCQNLEETKMPFTRWLINKQ